MFTLLRSNTLLLPTHGLDQADTKEDNKQALSGLLVICTQAFEQTERVEI